MEEIKFNGQIVTIQPEDAILIHVKIRDTDSNHDLIEVQEFCTNLSEHFRRTIPDIPVTFIIAPENRVSFFLARCQRDSP